MAPYFKYLSIILKEFSRTKENEPFPWNREHFYVILRRICSKSKNDKPCHSLEPLEKLAKRVLLSSTHDPRARSEKMVSFTEQLREFFKVPGLHPSFMLESSTSRIVKAVAGFIGFLLDIIADLWISSADMMGSVKEQNDILCKELKFLITILWDKPMQCAEIRGTRNLLIEIKEVANQVGSFLYFFFITKDRFGETRIDLGLSSLLGSIELLKENIKEHCITVSTLSKCMTPTTAVVSPFVLHFLVEDLEGQMNRDDEVKDQMRTLYDELMLFQSYLRNIEAANKGGNKKMEKIVMKIRDSAYETRYIINLFMVEDLPNWYFTVRLSDVINRIFHIKMDLVEIRKSYDIDVREVSKDSGDDVSSEAKMPPLVYELLVGFEDESTKIVEQLVGGSKKLQTISICGMPGLGKTTLANKLYNDHLVVLHFHIRAWCIVSQTYNKRNLLVGILINLIRELDKESYDEQTILTMEDVSLANEIYKSLKGRRYLLVVDDIWNLNLWDDLRRYFPDDGNGSRIMFTSRNKDAVPPDSIILELPFLSHDQCWDLLQLKVFQKKLCPPELVDIGKQIADYCQGVPLSVVVIASVLAKMEKRESLWQEVAASIKAHVSEDLNQCLNILELSYKHLPEHLKLCFLYFGVFPEDAEIPVRKLISLWIAEGFVHIEEQKSLEDVGEEYLMDLIGRSLVLVAKRTSTGRVKACHIHDLLFDLCLRNVKEEGFLNKIEWEFGNIDRACSSNFSGPLNSVSRPFGLHVRSLLGFSLFSRCYTYPSFKLLRVLEISIDSSLEAVALMVHLRYLSTAYLTPSIGNLVDLEVLIVQYAQKVSNAFLEMLMNLVKLRRLHFRSRVQLGLSMAKSFQMKNLKAVSFFRLYHGRDENVMKFFPSLHRLKCSFVVDGSSQMYPRIDFLTQLESLTVFLEGKVGWFQDMLSFPLNLKKLTLYKFKLSWQEVSTIGRLPKLEVLKLSIVSLQGRNWDTSDDEFQQLKFLKLDRLGISQWNSSSDHFPSLERLVLRKCNNLEEIPACLGYIPTLQMIEVETCVESVTASAIQIREEQQSMGNEELKVFVYP